MTPAAKASRDSTHEGGPWAPWSFCARPPTSISHPDQLRSAAWSVAVVPGTVASSLAAAGRWQLDQPLDADAHDWWFQTSFPATELSPNQPCHLCFDGLATLAEVWLNGQRLLVSDNMFRKYRVDVAPHVRPHNELVLGFRSLDHALKQKRPRPRWKTNLVANQQIRWQRTSLLGRIPGWTPPVAPVGPWRDVRLETGPVLLSDVRLTSGLKEGAGAVTIHARVHARRPVERVTLKVGQQVAHAECRADGDATTIRAKVYVPDPTPWWPHTHGDQPLFDCSLDIVSGGETAAFPCGKVGFRAIATCRDGRFELRVNGEPIYCRGACWTVSDIVALDGTPEVLERDLRLAKDAGVNMLRVGGTMIYESDAFYRLCDELGILIWQDFMFANMDYPVDDPDFAANIEAEAVETLGRLAAHPCVAVYCGNSEVEQQAAMLGMPENLWRNRWFAERLPALCSEHHKTAAYVPSTPSGGTLPFHVREGVAHYYGIGAYQRTPADLRKDDVAFSPECLGFANVPEQATLNLLGGGDAPAVHDPRWKERVPRDTGPGWDFDDVRDFYLGHLFGLDPVRLRSFDPDRYLQLSRVVSGEMMAQAFAEWRSSHSRNAGALVWFYKDLWPGAGWGIIDSRGVPKAAYYALRRVWQPRQIVVTDEGLEGLHLHVVNETAADFHGFVELVLLKDGHIVVAQEIACNLGPRSRQTLVADAILQGFYDVAYTYHFGPPKHDVAIATLLDERRQVVSETCHFPVRREPAFAPDAAVAAEAEQLPDGQWKVTVKSDRFLYGVSFDVKNFRPDDNYFHLSPLWPKMVRLTPTAPDAAKFTGYVDAINLKTPVRIAAGDPRTNVPNPVRRE